MRSLLTAVLLALALLAGAQATRSAFVSAGGLAPDLVVTGMVIELETGGSCAFTSTQLGVRVTVANQGAAVAGSFVVDVNGDQQTVSQGLAAGETLSLWFPGYQSGLNTAIVDATDQVAESDETNNQLSQTVPVPTLPAPCTATPTGPAGPTVTRPPTLSGGPTATTAATGLPATGGAGPAAGLPGWLAGVALAGAAGALAGWAVLRSTRAGRR